MILTIVVFVLTIAFLILIHEWGHFFLARRFKVWVHQFAIGFGPALLRYKRSETEYSLRVFPIGGFVRLAGEEPDSEEDKAVPPERLFRAKKPLARMAIISGGSLMNILGAVVLMIFTVGLFGVPYLEIIGFPEDSASRHVLAVGDKLIKVDGRNVYTIKQLNRLIQQKAAGPQPQPVTVVVKRGEELLTFSITPRWSAKDERYLIGVTLRPSLATRRPGPITSVMLGATKAWEIMVLLYQTVKGMIAGRLSPAEAFTGPVGIASFLGQSLNQGLMSFFMLVAILSLNLGIINLLPFPALDGSRLVFITYELIRRKPFPPQKEGWVHYVGFIILIGLMILITYKDILRLLR